MKQILNRINKSYIFAFLGELTLGFTFLLYIIIARVLGPQQYGVFAAAVALAGILSLFIQSGFPTLLTREVAANPDQGSKLTLTFLLLETLISLPVLLILLPLTRVLGFEGNGVIICYLVVLSEVCRCLKFTLRGVLKGRGWFDIETISVSLERFFTVLLAGLVLFLSKNLILVICTIVLVRILDILGILFYLARKVCIWSSLNFNHIRHSFRLALPFAVSGILWVFYYQVDLVMLEGLASSKEAGFYSASYKIMEIFSALPRVIIVVSFTKFAHTHKNFPNKLSKELYKSTRLLLAIVLPFVLLAGFVQTNLIQIIYGEEFTTAVQSLAILLPSIAVVMFDDLMQHFLMASGLEKRLPPLLLFATVVNVLSNIVVIPLLGAVGAAIATVFSGLVLISIELHLVNRIGYKKAAQSLSLLVFISFLLTAVPSLMLYGLNAIVAIGLLFLSLIAIFIVMQRANSFSKQIK